MEILAQIYLFISIIGFAIGKTAITLEGLSKNIMKWLFFPIVLIVSLVVFFAQRKKLRWYSKYWYVFGSQTFIYYMLYQDHDT